MTILDPTDIDLVTLCVLRYSMGRMSYIVSWAQEWVKKAWPHLDHGVRERYLQELNGEFLRADGFKNRLGSEIDYDSWWALYGWMGEHLEDPLERD